jgi:eukaryotic-like serine/threonine-protein kinase
MSEITEGPKPVKLLSLLALSHYNVASTHVIGTHLDKAFESYEKALEYRRALVEAHPSVNSFRENLGDSYREVAFQEQVAGHTQRALEALQKALDILEKLVHTEPEPAAYHAELGRAWNVLSFIHDETCDNVKAIPAFKNAMKEQKAAIGQSPDQNGYKAFLCMHLENLAEQSHCDDSSSRLTNSGACRPAHAPG